MAVNLIYYVYAFVVAVAAAVLLAPKPPKPENPNKETDFSAPTASESDFIPVCFGSPWASQPNVVAMGETGYDQVKTKPDKK